MNLTDLLMPGGISIILFGDKIYRKFLKDSNLLELSSIGLAAILYGNTIYTELIKHSIEQTVCTTRKIYDKILRY